MAHRIRAATDQEWRAVQQQAAACLMLRYERPPRPLLTSVCADIHSVGFDSFIVVIIVVVINILIGEPPAGAVSYPPMYPGRSQYTRNPNFPVKPQTAGIIAIKW